MSPLKRLSLYRHLERLLLVFIVIWVGCIAVLYGQGKLASYEIAASIGVAAIVLLALLFIQRTVSTWLSDTLKRVNYSQDAAFNTLYDNSPVAYLTIDTDGKVIEYNAAAVKLLHEQTGVMRGLDFYSVILSDDDTDASVLAGKISAGIIVNDIEVPIQTSVGDVVWVMMSVFAYSNATQRVVSLVDVTQQKNIDTAKSEFVALATHQLRTPIAAIRWNTELLHKNLKEVQTPARENYLIKIERNVIRMVDLINDFLSVSKLEMGTYATKVESINMSDFITNILEAFAGKVTEKNIKIDRTDTPPEADFKADSGLMHIIISNLISNAVKYTTTNGVLTISYVQQDDFMELNIGDTGIGIPADEIDSLFTKFYRASNAKANHTEGTGLGLYIVKQSVELLGGTIEVQSIENQGTHFVVRLPVV